MTTLRRAPLPHRAPSPGAVGRRTATTTFAAVVVAVSALLLVSGCSSGDPVPLGIPVPPAASTGPTAAPPTEKNAPTSSPDDDARSAPMAPPAPSIPIADAGLDAATADIAAPPPVHLAVPSVGVDMRVLPMSVDEAGQMELPGDSGQAGWYEWGPAPGDGEGTTLIAAHVDSLEFGLGQFVKLRDLTGGERVTLDSADGVTHRYTVSQVVRTPKTDVPLAELFDRSGAPRLVLVTCGGVFDRQTGHYLDNVIVTATALA